MVLQAMTTNETTLTPRPSNTREKKKKVRAKSAGYIRGRVCVGGRRRDWAGFGSNNKRGTAGREPEVERAREGTRDTMNCSQRARGRRGV